MGAPSAEEMHMISRTILLSVERAPSCPTAWVENLHAVNHHDSRGQRGRDRIRAVNHDDNRGQRGWNRGGHQGKTWWLNNACT